MRFTPTLQRLRARPVSPRLRFVVGGPGVFGVDVGEVLYQVALQELLQENGLRGKV
jgi:hypothetical protein